MNTDASLIQDMEQLAPIFLYPHRHTNAATSRSQEDTAKNNMIMVQVSGSDSISGSNN